MQPHRREILISLFIALTTFAVYLPVDNHGFVNFDDPMYITENARVLDGLKLENVIWAFTATYAGNWHPLRVESVAWASERKDCKCLTIHSAFCKIGLEVMP